jgi:predicted phosphodiesterase
VRVAALYDAHCNVHALDAVLAEVDADAIVFGGDVVWGQFPRETLERVRSLDDAYASRGNCEREVAGDRRELPAELAEVTEWCGEHLAQEELAATPGS